MQNSELMAGSQYPETTRLLLKTGLLLICYITFVFLTVDKKHHMHRRWINLLPQLLASHYLKTSIDVIYFNSGHTRKLKMVKIQVSFLPETLSDSGIWTKSGLVVLLEGW